MNPVLRYMPSIRRYSWILLASTLLAVGVGLVLTRTLNFYQASTIIQITPNLPSDSYTEVISPNDAISMAEGASQAIMTRSVMQHAVDKEPKIKQLGYSADNLLVNVVATASSSAPLVTITATTNDPEHSAVIANAVANGYVDYVLQQELTRLNERRTSLENQLKVLQDSAAANEQVARGFATTDDPKYQIAITKLNSDMKAIESVKTDLAKLPTTLTSPVKVLHPVNAGDASPAIKTVQVVGVTGAIGALLGVLAMLLMIFLDNRLLSAEDVRDKFGVAYLGGLGRDGEIGNAPTQARGIAAQELANIGANLRLTGVMPDQWKAPHGAVLLVTSVQTGEGKTSVSSALAAAMARGGCSTLIIDGNLRRPTTHLAFGVNAAGPGLSGLLKAGGNIDEIVKTSPIPGVWMLPAGAPMDDATLLLAQRFPSVLSQLRKKADLIIIDGPAILTGAEASTLASYADGTMMVVDFRHCRTPLLKRASDILKSLTSSPFGIMLNSYPRRGVNGYFASSGAVPARHQEYNVIEATSANGFTPVPQQKSSFLSGYSQSSLIGGPHQR